MKIYKIAHWDKDMSKPEYLIPFSKSVRLNGVLIYFSRYGRKGHQTNWKNGLRIGIDKVWLSSSKNWYFQNWKKDKIQGIEISFK